MSYFWNIDFIIAFFFLGVFASWIKSDLELPEAASKFLSIFLLLSLGLKGGHEVWAATELNGFGTALLLGLSSCLVIPLYVYHLLKKAFNPANATALAACYGSVSAVTFIAAQGLLENKGIPYNGYMIAVMALMEIPAIVVALYLYSHAQKGKDDHLEMRVFSAKSVVLLIGGFCIGILMNEKSWSSISPLVVGCFKGALAFFLLGLGVEAQRQIHEAWRYKGKALLLACGLPILNGSVALFIASYTDMVQGNQVIIATLVGSASYIAAPAAIRTSVPNANPSLYVALPLALTFPMNVVFGIPFYVELCSFLNR